MAPELLNIACADAEGAPLTLADTYDDRIMTWMFGSLAYELLCGRRPPWSGHSLFELLASMRAYDLRADRLAQGAMSDEAFDFLGLCLRFDKRSRPSLQLLLDHAWIRDCDAEAIHSGRAALRRVLTRARPSLDLTYPSPILAFYRSRTASPVPHPGNPSAVSGIGRASMAKSLGGNSNKSIGKSLGGHSNKSMCSYSVKGSESFVLDDDEDADDQPKSPSCSFVATRPPSAGHMHRPLVRGPSPAASPAPAQRISTERDRGMQIFGSFESAMPSLQRPSSAGRALFEFYDPTAVPAAAPRPPGARTPSGCPRPSSATARAAGGHEENARGPSAAADHRSPSRGGATPPVHPSGSRKSLRTQLSDLRQVEEIDDALPFLNSKAQAAGGDSLIADVRRNIYASPGRPPNTKPILLSTSPFAHRGGNRHANHPPSPSQYFALEAEQQQALEAQETKQAADREACSYRAREALQSAETPTDTPPTAAAQIGSKGPSDPRLGESPSGVTGSAAASVPASDSQLKTRPRRTLFCNCLGGAPSSTKYET